MYSDGVQDAAFAFTDTRDGIRALKFLQYGNVWYNRLYVQEIQKERAEQAQTNNAGYVYYSNSAACNSGLLCIS